MNGYNISWLLLYVTLYTLVVSGTVSTKGGYFQGFLDGMVVEVWELAEMCMHWTPKVFYAAYLG